jgi:hypothetical protein
LTSLPATGHLRWAASGQNLWDCHFFYNGTKWKKDFTIHNGFGWPLDERVKFGKRIRCKGWPNDWFSTATSDEEPWIFYLSEQYIEHCLEMIEQVLDAIGGFIRDDLIRER